MRRSHETALDWRDRLSQAGVPDLGERLGTEASPDTLPGHWTPLTKANLGGRQRWRWQLDAGLVGGIRTDTLYIKRYRRASLREQLDRMLRQSLWHSRAWWEFEQAAALARAQIDAPQPVAFAERMWTWMERSSAVCLTGVEGDGFDRVWTRIAAAGAPITRGRARHDLVRRLGRFISAFHQSGRCHRDLYLCHVFVALDPAGRSPPRFALIDLARVMLPGLRRMRWLVKDLAQLDSSARQIGARRTDRLRFLLAYLGLEPGAPRIHAFVRSVLRKSDGILRRAERREARR